MAAPIGEPTVGCPAGEWCWARHRPLTLGGDRRLGTAFAIGPEGTFLRWESDRWSSSPVPTRRALRSAWVASPERMFASDEIGGSWIFDHGTWAAGAPAPAISRIMGGPNATAFAIAGGSAGGHGGANGSALLRYDGTSWTSAVPAAEYCVGGDYVVRASGEVWSSGLTCDAQGAVNGLEVRRFVGGAWVIVGAPISGQGWYPAIEELGDRVRVRATGTFEWDGAAWIRVELPFYPQDLPIDQVGVWDGIGYTTVPRSTGCSEGYRSSPALAWCSGEAGIHVETTRGWASTIIDAYAETRSAAEWGTLPPELWAGGDAQHAWGLSATQVYRSRWSTGRKLEVYDGSRWSVARDVEVIDIDGSDDGWMYALTRTSLLRVDLRAPTPSFIEEDVPDVFGAPGELRDVHAFRGGRAYVVSQNLLFEFDGTGWAALHAAPAGWELRSTAGTGGRDHWLLTHQSGRSDAMALFFSESGASWSPIDVPGLSGFGELRTSAGETWLASDGIVASLSQLTAPMPVPARVFDASVWTDGRELWLRSPQQALRFGR